MGFSSGPEATHTLNAAGTRQTVQLAADADAVMYHVSTAFVDRTDLTRAQMGQDHGDTTARPEDYLDSKRAGEEVVRSAGIPAVIVRPSVVIGDAATGAISAFQSMHGIIHGLLRGLLPLVPIPADSPVDFVPQDVVAATLAGLIRQGRREGEVWVTAGAHALSTDRALEVIAATVVAGHDLAEVLVIGNGIRAGRKKHLPAHPALRAAHRPVPHDRIPARPAAGTSTAAPAAGSLRPEGTLRSWL
ncbi:SDR family oxidoreductase [Streptomyces griseoincarnatus]